MQTTCPFVCGGTFQNHYLHLLIGLLQVVLFITLALSFLNLRYIGNERRLWWCSRTSINKDKCHEISYSPHIHLFFFFLASVNKSCSMGSPPCCFQSQSVQTRLINHVGTYTSSKMDRIPKSFLCVPHPQGPMSRLRIQHGKL